MPKFYVKTGAGTYVLIEEHAEGAAVSTLDRLIKMHGKRTIRYFDSLISVSERGFEDHVWSKGHSKDVSFDTGIVLDAVKERRKMRKK